jgi:hypothetical protein
MPDHAASHPVSRRSMNTAAFAFPLNVYARLLELREGRVDYLHYGVFEAPDEPVTVAQQRASDLMWQALPGPCRLLEVGVGLGTTLARLRAAGYEATGITPDAAQIQAARERCAGTIAVEQSRLEDFDRGAGQWQALLFQESGQYIAPVALFEAADRLLHEGASSIVVMDEFALDRREDGDHGLHALGAFCALAARRGWTLTKRVDLSRQARPTLDYLRSGLETLAQPLAADLGIAHEELATLAASIRRYQRLYDEGVYGYALLRFDRAARPEDRLVETGPAQAPAMRQLFSDVFRHEMSPEHWHWKYGDGRGRGIALMRGDRMLAHYGGVTRRVLCRGEAVLASQSCDVMVDQRGRSGLVRHGPMAQVASTFLETQLGWGQPHRLGFGFPSDRAFGAAERLGLYAAVDTVMRASWPPAARSASASEVAEELRAADLAPGGRRCAAVDGLWHGMAESLRDAIVGVRDSAWLHHRYFARPGVSYRAFYLRRRWTRRPVGVVVLRRHERHLEVLDLVGPPTAFAALIAQARRHAADAALERVDCWITTSQLHLLSAIDPPAFTATPMGITVPANVHTPGPVDDLRGRWFLLAGDADFT